MYFNRKLIIMSETKYQNAKKISEGKNYDVYEGELTDPDLIRKLKTKKVFFQKAKRDFTIKTQDLVKCPDSSPNYYDPETNTYQYRGPQDMEINSTTKSLNVKKGDVSGPIAAWKDSPNLNQFMENTATQDDKHPFWVDDNSSILTDNLALSDSYLKNTDLMVIKGSRNGSYLVGSSLEDSNIATRTLEVMGSNIQNTKVIMRNPSSGLYGSMSNLDKVTVDASDRDNPIILKMDESELKNANVKGDNILVKTSIVNIAKDQENRLSSARFKNYRSLTSGKAPTEFKFNQEHYLGKGLYLKPETPKEKAEHKAKLNEIKAMSKVLNPDQDPIKPMSDEEYRNLMKNSKPLEGKEKEELEHKKALLKQQQEDQNGDIGF